MPGPSRLPVPTFADDHQRFRTVRLLSLDRPPIGHNPRDVRELSEARLKRLLLHRPLGIDERFDPVIVNDQITGCSRPVVLNEGPGLISALGLFEDGPPSCTRLGFGLLT